MFENILVCLDGSKLAEQILPYVEAQALQFVSKVTLLQVVTLPSSTIAAAGPVPTSGEIIAEQLHAAEDEAKAYLLVVRQLLESKGIEVEAVTVQGVPAGVGIVEYAQKNEIDLIAISTHGRSGFGRAVFGSVADIVLRESGIPILIIKPREV